MKIQRETSQFSTQRTIQKVDNDLYLFENDIEIKKDFQLCHVSGPINIISIFYLYEGQGIIESGSSKIEMAAKIALVMPINSLVTLKTTPAKLKIVNFCSIKFFSSYDCPFVFNISQLADFNNVESIKCCIEKNNLSFLKNEKAHEVSLSLKKYIDNSYADNQKLDQFVPKLSMARSTVTYHFKKDFGTTPKNYLSRVRVTASIFDLIRGSEVTKSAFQSGFNDLGRFYKNFKEIAHSTPKKYRG